MNYKHVVAAACFAAVAGVCCAAGHDRNGESTLYHTVISCFKSNLGNPASPLPFCSGATDVVIHTTVVTRKVTSKL